MTVGSSSNAAVRKLLKIKGEQDGGFQNLRSRDLYWFSVEP
ncbi:hypothetical protein 18India_21 [Salmonella phage 18-India]|nr:hypothetical protein 18India_21 [Salmonella phage 18-India]